MVYHVPVLLQQCSEFLISKNSGTYFDATLGFGGHSSHFLSLLDSNSRIIAVDKDKNAYEYCESKFADDKRMTIYNTSFTDLRKISLVDKVDGYDGIFADLGVSSFQFDNAESGFTYREEAILDLRMDKSEGNPAYEFINNAESEELANVIFNYGEERNSRQIARSIVKARSIEPIKTTIQLKEAVQKVTSQKNQNKTLSRVFQALRIHVNNELDELKTFLKQTIDLLKIGGRIVILSYHSLEDRIVKDFFNYEALSCICPKDIPICVCGKKSTLKVLTRKPVTASEKEVSSNPRARSAKLRAAEKI